MSTETESRPERRASGVLLRPHVPWPLGPPASSDPGPASAVTALEGGGGVAAAPTGWEGADSPGALWPGNGALDLASVASLLGRRLRVRGCNRTPGLWASVRLTCSVRLPAGRAPCAALPGGWLKAAGHLPSTRACTRLRGSVGCRDTPPGPGARGRPGLPWSVRGRPWRASVSVSARLTSLVLPRPDPPPPPPAAPREEEQCLLSAGETRGQKPVEDPC